VKEIIRAASSSRSATNPCAGVAASSRWYGRTEASARRRATGRAWTRDEAARDDIIALPVPPGLIRLMYERWAASLVPRTRGALQFPRDSSTCSSSAAPGPLISRVTSRSTIPTCAPASSLSRRAREVGLGPRRRHRRAAPRAKQWTAESASRPALAQAARVDDGYGIRCTRSCAEGRMRGVTQPDLVAASHARRGRAGRRTAVVSCASRSSTCTRRAAASDGHDPSLTKLIESRSPASRPRKS